MCNCFDMVLSRVTEKLKPKKEVAGFKTDWKGQVLRLDGGCGIGLYVESEFYNIKKDGTLFANKTKDSHFIALSFCPFCGEKLEVKNARN